MRQLSLSELSQSTESVNREALLAPTDGRTDRTHEEPHCATTSSHGSNAHTRVQAVSTDEVLIGDVIAAGFLPTGERFPVLRTGEREPIPYHVRAAVWLRDRGICQKCKARDPKPWELDHIVPWSAGGSDASENLRVLCEPCNQRRSNYDDRTTFARRPVTWWCHRCYVDPVAWDYSHPWGIYCPTHRHNASDYAPGCAVERVYHWQRKSGETPTWHKRAPIEALTTTAHCAHCGVPGLTDVTL